MDPKKNTAKAYPTRAKAPRIPSKVTTSNPVLLPCCRTSSE